jgi:hypothetical protein
MEQASIGRRRFVGILLSASCIASTWKWRWLARDSSPEWFYIAGVRFNPVHTPPDVDEPVRIERRDWRGHACYEVQTQNGERLGYVPRRRILAIQKLTDGEWRVSKVNAYGVPWKRYKIRRVS